MKQRKLNRFFIYILGLLIIVAAGAIIYCSFQGIKDAQLALAAVIIVLTFITLRFFNVDGGHYKRKINKTKEKDRMLFAMIPELFTEELPDDTKLQVDGDSDGEFGIQKGKVKKDVFLSHIHPDHIERYNKAYKQMLAGAAMSTAKIQWANVQNEYIWCDYHMTAAYNDENKIERIIGVLVSTDRKLKADRKSEQIFSSIKSIYRRMIFVDIPTDQYEYLLSDDLVYYNYEKNGSFQTINEDYINQYVMDQYQPRLREILSLDYMSRNLNKDNKSYCFDYQLKSEADNWETVDWETVEVILVNMDRKRACQVLVTVRDKMDHN